MRRGSLWSNALPDTDAVMRHLLAWRADGLVVEGIPSQTVRSKPMGLAAVLEHKLDAHAAPRPRVRPSFASSLPGLVQLFAGQTAGVANGAGQVIEERVAGKAIEVPIGQAPARRVRERHYLGP